MREVINTALKYQLSSVRELLCGTMQGAQTVEEIW